MQRSLRLGATMQTFLMNNGSHLSSLGARRLPHISLARTCKPSHVCVALRPHLHHQAAVPPWKEAWPHKDPKHAVRYLLVIFCLYVYKHVCTHVCKYVCTYVCMYVCMAIYDYVCLFVCLPACLPACLPCMHACMHACMHVLYVVYVLYVCIHVCMFVCMILYVVRMHKYIHIHICTHVCFSASGRGGWYGRYGSGAS